MYGFLIDNAKINTLRNCCNRPGKDIEKIQGRNGVEIRKYGINPDDTEHTGAHYHDNGGNHAFAKTSGGRYGAVHERRHHKRKAHNTQSLHAGIYNLGVVGKQR